MSGAGGEHWLDLLAARQTRRDVLRAALAGTALTLPLARPTAIHAANRRRGIASSPCKLGPSNDPKACQKGCFATSNLRAGRAFARCANQGGLTILSGTLLLGPMGVFPTLATWGVGLIGETACQEAALLHQKATQFDCLKPNCPGFDPCGSDGPCEGLPPDVFCCPDQTSWNGYIPCAQCCSPTGSGCGSGTSECGGGGTP